MNRAGGARAARIIGNAIARAAVLALGATSCTPASDASDVVVEEAWMRAMPAGAPVAGGYLTLRNAGTRPDRLVSVHSRASSDVQVHEVRHEDGMARMRPVVDGLVLPPDSTVVMRPGGVHLMFLSPLRPIEDGMRVPATLQFERAGAVEVAFEVRAAGAMPSAAEHDHH